MPTYGYRCGSCGHEFEIVQRITAEPLEKCPKCGGKLAKMLYPTGVIFRGSGFYKTDYRGAAETAARASSNGTADASGSGSDSSSGGGSESKTETKPEKKSEAKAEAKSESKSKSDSKSEKKTS